MIEFVTHYKTGSMYRIEIKVDGKPVSIYLMKDNTIEIVGSVTDISAEKDASNSVTVRVTP